MKKLAIFASGAGSNAEKIIETFCDNNSISISLIVCNNPSAGVLKIAESKKIPFLILEKEKFFNGNGFVDELKAAEISFIVLAGFLWKVPETLIRVYPKKIINIHPALLPKYGGKGMYGNRVHEAVIAAGEKESGISIHFVDDLYDHGQIILQAKCMIEEKDDAVSLAKKIHLLEHRHFSATIATLL